MAKAVAKAVATEVKTSRRWLRVKLSNEELLSAGKLQADRSLELVAVEADRKRQADEMKAKATALEAELTVLASKVSTGYEYRWIGCTERLGFPTATEKKVTRDDNGELVGIEEMNQAEMQRCLNLAEPGAA